MWKKKHFIIVGGNIYEGHFWQQNKNIRKITI